MEASEPNRGWERSWLRWLAAMGCLLPCLAAAYEEAAGSGAATDLTQLSLQELMAGKIEQVSTPSRFTQKTADAPSSVTVITSQEIQIYGYRTLADVLSSVPGLYVTADRSYTYLGFRGFNRPSDYNSRVLLLVDGHRMNDALFGAGFIGREFVLDVDLIDRVEIVRGPSSSLYGSSAFFGVINVITKRAADLKTVEVSGEVGTEESYKGRFTISGTLTNSGAQFVLSASYYDSQGNRNLYFPEFNQPANNNGIAHNLDGEEALNLYGSLVWKDLTLSAAYVTRDKYIPTASWSTLFNDPRYNTEDDHGYLDLKWQHSLDDQNDFMARVYFDDYRYQADYPGSPPTPLDLGLTRDDDVAQTVGGELQWVRRWREHVFTLGGEWRDNFRQDQSYYNVSPRIVYLDDRSSSLELAVYGQAEIALLKNLHLNAGLRYDHYEDFGGTANPRFGLIYTPRPRTTLKLLYGTAFRSPNLFETRYQVLPYNLGNLNLQPEKIQTYELVVEQGLPADLQLSLSGYYYHIDDLINQAQVAPNSYMFENTGEADAKGIEAGLDWRPAWGLRARASYAVQRAEDVATGNRLVNSPQQLAKLNVFVPLWKDRVFTGVEVQYASGVETLGGEWIDGFCTVNWTLFSRRLLKGLECSASLYNLLDARYAFPGGPGHTQDLLWQDGRSFRVKLTYRF